MVHELELQRGILASRDAGMDIAPRQWLGTLFCSFLVDVSNSALEHTGKWSVAANCVYSLLIWNLFLWGPLGVMASHRDTGGSVKEFRQPRSSEHDVNSYC